KGIVLSESDLLSILYHLNHHREIRKSLDREEKELELVFQISRTLKPIKKLEFEIEKTISPEGIVKDNASRKLSQIRKQLKALQTEIRRQATFLFSKYSKLGILRGDSETIRDGRFVLPVRSEAFRKVNGIVHDRSSTGNTIFIEPIALINNGNEIRTLELSERDEVRKILLELTDEVRIESEQLKQNLDVITNLDCLWAKARYADALEASMPLLIKEGSITISGGRHPLLVIGLDRRVIPLNLDLGNSSSCLVISGPNAGGKSVAMKCVGLLCVMTSCGMHIPAEPGTEIPLFHSFHAIIGDQQSIMDDLSTFSAHTLKLKKILEQADSKSLILIDEIGSGTDPHEGAALSMAVLEDLARKKIKTVVTTHHGELKAFAHSTENCCNGSMEFDEVNFVPTFKFRPDLPGSSYALDIAQRVGMPGKVIVRAKEIIGRDRTEFDQLIHDLTEKIAQYESLVKNEKKQETKKFNLIETYQRKLKRVQEKEKTLRQDFARETEEKLSLARKEIESVVKEIKESKADRNSIKNAHEKVKSISKRVKTQKKEPVEVLQEKRTHDHLTRQEQIKKDIANITTDQPLRKPVKDDWVVIDDSGAKGIVESMSSKGDRVCIGIGSVHLWISLDRVKLISSPESQIITVKTPSSLSVPKVPLEIDIRGLDSVEAIEKVDRYLYDGAAQGRVQLGIIHGKGKGILSNKVREHLKQQKIVESYRFGEYGEGDFGVTVVRLIR
nr:Smr/MutS family protein [bacterium]